MLESQWPNSASSQLVGSGPGDQYSGLLTGWRDPGDPSPELSLAWDLTPPSLHALSGITVPIHLPSPLSWAADPTGASPDLPSQLEGVSLQLQAGRKKGRQILRALAGLTV